MSTHEAVIGRVPELLPPVLEGELPNQPIETGIDEPVFLGGVDKARVLFTMRPETSVVRAAMKVDPTWDP